MDDIQAGLRYAFQTKNPLTFALSASGHSAMEAMMTNMLEPGDVVLVANSGIWGQRAADMAHRQGACARVIRTKQVHNYRPELKKSHFLRLLRMLGPPAAR